MVESSVLLHTVHWRICSTFSLVSSVSDTSSIGLLTIVAWSVEGSLPVCESLLNISGCLGEHVLLYTFTDWVFLLVCQ